MSLRPQSRAIPEIWEPEPRDRADGGRPIEVIPLRTDGIPLAEPQQSPPIEAAASPPRRVDLLRMLPPLKWLLSRRWFQFAAVLPMLLAFLVLLAAGVFGTPVGNRNISIVFVWILWWFLLISVMVPFASRIWCAVCPIPFFGEWFQRRALVGVRAVDRSTATGSGTLIGRNRYFGWNRRWPRALQNIWLQNVGFLVLCTFSVFLLTRPIVTAVALAFLILVATALHLVYRQRAFCSYLCPVGGFLSLFSMASMLEVRVKRADICRKCRDKGCLAGNERGWGCPWSVYPSKLQRNNSCGLCMECIKTCPHDNMTLNLRPFCADTGLKGYDEAWKAFIMISLAFTYSVIYQGPWGFLKDWANASESGQWAGFLIYASVLWLGAMVVVPAFHYLAVWTGRKLARKHEARSREVFLGFAYPLVPVGLLAWVAFSLPLVLVNGSYVLTVLSDPFGWGWDIFGTADVAWRPLVPHWAPYLQTLILLTGLAFGLKTGYGNAARLFDTPRQALRAFIPSALLLGVIVASFLILYVG